MDLRRSVVITLISICIVGVIGIPMGDPKFFAQAISLELGFVILAFLSTKKIRYALIPNIIIGTIVIIGNTLSPQHIEIMSSFTPIGNATVLIIGGYFLQFTLIFFSVLLMSKRNQLL